MKILLWLFVLASLSAVVLSQLLGGPSPLSQSDLDDPSIIELAKKGLNTIHKLKKQQNSLPSCVILDGVLKSGTQQVVAGFSYDFIIEVTPKKSTSSKCSAQNVDISSLPKEECTVNIWEQPGVKEAVIKVEECHAV